MSKKNQILTLIFTLDFWIIFILCHTKSGGILLCYTLRKFWNFEYLSVRPSVSASFPDSNLSSFWPIFFKLCKYIDIGEEWFGIANGLNLFINNRVMALNWCKNVFFLNIFRTNGWILIKFCLCIDKYKIHVVYNTKQLLTFVEVDMKFYWTVNFILTDAKRRSIWFVYCSITLHVHWNKRQQLFYYIKAYFSWKVCHLEDFTSKILVDVTSQTMRQYDGTSQTIRHYFTWSDVIIHIRALHHKQCDIKYCWPHMISLWANEMQFIYSLYNKHYFWSTFYRVTALDRRQNFVYAQYLVNKFLDFDQILYMHWYWQDVDLDDLTIFFVHFQQSYGPWLML